MAKIGAYRLSIYHLFYNLPLYEFSERKNGRLEQNVLILGSGWAGNEAFKTAFWVGQNLQSSLNITVASSNATKYESRIREVLPAFSRFSEKKGYASVRFIDAKLDKKSVEADLSVLDFENVKYNYVIVALGDAEHNLIAATEVMLKISLAREAAGYNGRVLINVFDDFSDMNESEDKKTLAELGKELDITVSFFGKEIPSPDSELLRIARNINFAYTMKYDQRAGKKDADEEFLSTLQNEFIDSPSEFESGCLDIVNNFIGSNYAADSSIASALHIPYKLHACGLLSPSANPIEALAEAIGTKSKLYNELVALEHRRWNAYMVTRGYRAPTKEEEEKYLYRETDGRMNKHKDDTKLLHACLCDCGRNGAVLEGDFYRQFEAWEKNPSKSKLSELDIASLRCHSLSARAAAEADVWETVSRLELTDFDYSYFKKSIVKLQNDEENAIVLYERELERAKEHAAEHNKNALAILKKIDKRLTPAKEHNRRMDFMSLDAQLIEMIPFCLWYEKENRTVITLSSENAVEDVIIPTLLCAKKAIFVYSGRDAEKYTETVQKYFQKRGSTTSPEFIISRGESAEELTETLYGLASDGDAVLNCTSHKDPVLAIAMGRIIERMKGRITALHYGKEGRIIALSGSESVAVGINNKSLSVSEYITLIGGKILSEHIALYDTSKMADIADVFYKFSDLRKLKGSTTKSDTFLPWATITAFLQLVTKNDSSVNKRVLASLSDSVLTYKGSFRHDVYAECEIGKALQFMNEFSVIRNLSQKDAFSRINVSFDYCEAAIAEILSEFEEKNTRSAEEIRRAKHKLLRFTLADGFFLSSRLVDKKPISKEGEKPQETEVKKAFLKDIYNKGLITKPDYDAEGNVSFAFFDMQTMNIFKQQGECFELIVYNALRNSAAFGDIEKGTVFVWDKDDEDKFTRLKKVLERKKNFGYTTFMKEKNALIYSETAAETTRNEIDIIAVNGMQPLFVSCKTGKKALREWLYEVDSVSSHFNARAAIAVSLNFEDQPNPTFMNTASEMGITVLGTDTLKSPERLNAALRTIEEK